MSHSKRTVHRCVTRLVLGAAAVVAAGAAFAVEDDGRELPPAIPPGQEALVMEMLGKGADLPGGCKLGDGKIEYTVIEASYDCGGDRVVVELAHSSWAVDSDVQTRHFALGVTKGSAPASLVDTLAQRILDREDEFEFLPPKDDSGDGPAAE